MRESEQLQTHENAIESVGLKPSHSLSICWPSSQDLVEQDWHIGRAIKDELALHVADAQHFDVPFEERIIKTEVPLFAPLDQYSLLDVTLALLFVLLRRNAFFFEHGCERHHHHVNHE